MQTIVRSKRFEIKCGRKKKNKVILYFIIRNEFAVRSVGNRVRSRGRAQAASKRAGDSECAPAHIARPQGRCTRSLRDDESLDLFRINS